MNLRKRSIAYLSLLLACAACPLTQAADVKLYQILSRENPNFDKIGDLITLGKDGNVYISGRSYVYRLSLDGKKRLGGTTLGATTGLAVNKDGILATANAHFNKSVNLYDPTYTPVAQLGGFTGNDIFGWDGPGSVEAGVSGDFYALDQHVHRIVRLNVAGKTVKIYPMPTNPDLQKLNPATIRVNESHELFYYLYPNHIYVAGFDGTPKWDLAATVGGNPWDGYTGGFDVSEDGSMYVLEALSTAIKVYDAAGKPSGEIPIHHAGGAPTPETRNSGMRINDTDILIRQRSETELFADYDRKTGEFKSSSSIDHERLSLTIPSLVWTAGEAIPATIEFVTGTYKAAPAWKFWIRPYNESQWVELPIVDGKITPPADWAGVYQIKLNSGANGADGEYIVREVVQIRTKDATGSALILTPNRRVEYAAGETIPVSVLVRGANAPASVELKLLDATNNAIQSQTVNITADKSDTWTLAPAVTQALKPGAYRVSASLPGFSVVTQLIQIGPGEAHRSPITFMRYGDYGMVLPVDATVKTVAEVVTRFVDQSEKVGVDFFADRLGDHLNFNSVKWAGDPELIERLKADPNGFPPETAIVDAPAAQAMAALSARGWKYMGIPTYMDDGLPIGVNYDGTGNPGPAADKKVADRVIFDTQALKDFPAFKGWSWTANWWVIRLGGAAAQTPEQKQAYTDAKKIASDTGKWSPVLDEVSDIWQNQTVHAQDMLRRALDTVDPTRKSAVSGPYRSVQVYPPLTFSNVDEVDLHYQSEQIQPPGVYWHDVDYQKRPGKLAWGHPELWNDDGTGGQIGTTLFAMLMRGVDGIGVSGDIPNWGRQHDDARSGYPATVSLFRAISQSMKPYFPFFASIKRHDPIAIFVSRRMFRFDDAWTGQLGAKHFDRLFEAYQACLASGMPARFVFAEDVNEQTFEGTKAILLVDERVELEPSAKAILDKAKSANIPIFYDASCRPEMMDGYAPLEVAFNHVDVDESAWQDDSAYWRFARYTDENVKNLREALAGTVDPIAKIDVPGVLVTEGTAGDARTLWVVNNRMLDGEPGTIWRTSNLITARMPQLANVGWSATGTIYDAMTLKPVERHADGTFVADLRNMPARLFVCIDPKQTSIERTLFEDAATPNASASGTAPVAIRPAATWFGPHLRDVAIDEAKGVATFGAMNRDRNVFVVDLKNGQAKLSRVGDAFTIDAQARPHATYVTGFDSTSPEGYVLYRIGATETHRFAAYHLSNRPTNWAFSAMLVDRPPAFAVASDESWIASGGNLGLVVWSPDGAVKWQQDWWKEKRHNALLSAMGNDTLIVSDGMTSIALNTADGAERWRLTFAQTGTIQQTIASSDAKTLVVRSDTEGGRIFVIRDGKVINTFATPVDSVSVSSDGSTVAAIVDKGIKLFDVEKGLLWNFGGDHFLHSLGFSKDGSRLAFCSELGTLYVLDRAGNVLLTRDVDALATFAWLEDGSLIVGNWNGMVTRLDANFASTWTTQVASDAMNYPAEQVIHDTSPMTRMSNWGNASDTPAALENNLLKSTNAELRVFLGEWQPPLKIDPNTITDGKPDAPAEPWITWGTANYVDSGWRGPLSIELDTFRTQIRVDSITFVEDPTHPESWLRDCVLEYWDARAEKWIQADNLLSNSAAHTHVLKKPVAAQKFRLISSGLGGTWPAGNIRLGEIVLHGEALGASAPDVVEKKPVAILFDEKLTELQTTFVHAHNTGFILTPDPTAYSGGSIMRYDPGALPEAVASPLYSQKFGSTVPGWDFEIVENPQPGQYRYLRFAWRAPDPKTTGIALRLGDGSPNSPVWHAGDTVKFELPTYVKLRNEVPRQWQVETIDLWKAFGQKPARVRMMQPATKGGPAEFDRILLGTSIAALDAAK